jgi:hypothetical protein
MLRAATMFALVLSAHATENMTLCRDRCVSDCRSYTVPLDECFSPPLLWPDDPQWGSEDVRDQCLNETHFQRSFFSSTNASCENPTGGFELPIGACIGPFGKPRPWGVFQMHCSGAALSEQAARRTDQL